MNNKLSILNNLEDIRLLRALYKNNLEKNLIGFHVLDNFLKWLENEPNIKHVTIYSLNDEWRQFGLYMIVDRYGLFLNSLKPNDENLGIALKLLDWTRSYKITGLPEQHYQIVVNTLEELNVRPGREVHLQVYRLPWQKALNLKINCPSDYELKKLDLDSAAIVDAHFYSQQSGSLFYFERLIKHNLSVGVFLRSNNELVAWCTRCQNGFIASLFVREEHRRRGLAELIANEFAQKLAQQDKPEDTLAAVYIHNNASNCLFKKLGYENVTMIYHMYAYSKSMEWPFD